MSLRVGIIGLKGHQGVILNGVQAIDDARLVAFCDDEAGLATVSGFTAKDESIRTFSDPMACFDEVEMDIVGICGTDGDRANMIIAAAERGIHVMAEKPLALKLDELERIRQAVTKSGIHLTMLLTMRFEPPYRTIRRVIAECLIGEVCQASGQKSYRLGNRAAWQRSRETFSGIIPFVGIHALDFIRWTTGREYVAGAAWSANVAHPEMRDLEDCAAIALGLDNGGCASVRLDFLRPAAAPSHGDDRLRVAGDQGVVEYMVGGEVMLITADEEPRAVPMEERADQFVDFVGSIRGEHECAVPDEDCFRMTEVCLKLRDGANGSAVVDLA